MNECFFSLSRLFLYIYWIRGSDFCLTNYYLYCWKVNYYLITSYYLIWLKLMHLLKLFQVWLHRIFIYCLKYTLAIYFNYYEKRWLLILFRKCRSVFYYLSKIVGKHFRMIKISWFLLIARLLIFDSLIKGNFKPGICKKLCQICKVT